MLFWCYHSFYFWAFWLSCINYLTCTFSMKAFSKMSNIHVFLMKQTSLLKNAKGNGFILFHKHTDWWPQESGEQITFQNIPLEKISKITKTTNYKSCPVTRFSERTAWRLAWYKIWLKYFHICWSWTFIFHLRGNRGPRIVDFVCKVSLI